MVTQTNNNNNNNNNETISQAPKIRTAAYCTTEIFRWAYWTLYIIKKGTIGQLHEAQGYKS